MTQSSTSQQTYERAALALKWMPSQGGAACVGRRDFDKLAETSKVPQTVRNQLSRICAPCPVADCGWRQEYKRERNPRKSRAKK